jgi:transposase
MPRTQQNLQLDEDMRERIIGMHLAHTKPPEIALLLAIPLSTVYSLLRRFKNRGHAKVLPRSGRPHKLTQRNKKTIIFNVEKDRFASCAEIIANTKLQVSTKTVAKVLHNAGFHSRTARSKPFLKPNHVISRLEWALQKSDWTMEEWKRIIWTDEASVEIGRDSSARRVWRTKDEEFLHSCIKPTYKSGRTSVMIWGAIVHGRLGPLFVFPEGKIKSDVYIDDILKGPFLDFYRSVSEERGRAKFMEDGAPIHNTIRERQWIIENDIDRLSWCANSPDLNPIEHVWKLLKRNINRRNIARNREELTIIIKEEWGKIDVEFLKNVVESMPRRVQTVIDSNGGHTRY